MTLPRALYQACADIGRSLSPGQAEKLAITLATHDGRDGADAVEFTLPPPAFRASVKRLLNAWAQHPNVAGNLLGPAIAAAAHAHELARTDPHIQLVMSGPSSPHLHSRMTDQILLDVIDAAQTDLLLVTYSLYMYPDLKASLENAVARNVQVTVLAEDPKDKAGFTGNPAGALAGIAATRLRWPKDLRPAGATSLHAKLAIADTTTVLLTSANLSQKASGDNLEAGLLIKGGDLASRLTRHIADLRGNGTLTDT